MRLFLSSLLFVACATRQDIPRVPVSFYFQFLDGSISKSEVQPDGTRKITDNVPIDEWLNLRGFIALPVSEYEMLLNRESLL